jgi:hypothetical protein
MICIDLVDNTASVKHVAFQVVPVTKEKEFRCNPDGILPLRSVVRVSRELKAGRTFGRVGKYLWYRLTGTPAVTHKRPISAQK